MGRRGGSPDRHPVVGHTRTRSDRHGRTCCSIDGIGRQERAAKQHGRRTVRRGAPRGREEPVRSQRGIAGRSARPEGVVGAPMNLRRIGRQRRRGIEQHEFHRAGHVQDRRLPSARSCTTLSVRSASPLNLNHRALRTRLARSTTAQLREGELHREAHSHEATAAVTRGSGPESLFMTRTLPATCLPR